MSGSADDKPFSPDPAGLICFLEETDGPSYDNNVKNWRPAPKPRSQALGQALEPERLEGLARYEIHLGRNLERTLAMLLKLKDLRRPMQPA